MAAVNLHESIHAFLLAALNLQHRCCLHLAEQALGNAAAADLDAFGFQPDLRRLTDLQGIQAFRQLVFVVLTAGLCWKSEISETAAAVMRQSFEIHDANPITLQLQQEICFACACATAEHAQGPGSLELFQNPAPIALVPTFQHRDRVITQARQPGHAVGAHAATPAIQTKRLPRPACRLPEGR